MRAVDQDFRSFKAALRLLRADPTAMASFDVSERGFWASFKTLPPVVGLYLVLDLWSDSGTSLTTVMIHTVLYVLDYLSLALIMIPVTRTTGLGHRYVPFIIASNWASLAAGLAITLFSLLTSHAGDGDGMAILNLLLLLGLALYQWNVTRISLGTRPLATLAVMIIGAAASLSLSKLSDLLTG